MVGDEHVLLPFESFLSLLPIFNVVSWAADAGNMEITTLKRFKKVMKCISGKFDPFDLESSSASNELYDFEQIITSLFPSVQWALH